MARKKSSMTLSNMYEVTAAAPFDARTVVPTKADLFLAENWPFVYAGLKVYVQDEKKEYLLVDRDPTDEANWKEQGDSSGLAAKIGDLSVLTTENKDLAGALEETRQTAAAADQLLAEEVNNRYTKAETDAKIAEALTDVDNEHFHPVTALPAVEDAKENHEYVLIEYEQDGTTIKSETHYLFYGGAFHEKATGGVSLDGYATEEYVDDRTYTVEQIKNYAEDRVDDMLSNGRDNMPASKGYVNARTFVAEYNVTTAQQIIAYIDSGATAPIVVKRGNDYYTSIFAQKVNDTKAIIRALGTLSGSYYVFTYTVTNGSWASSSHGFQNLLVSGTNIKTVNGVNLLGGGDITLDATGMIEVDTSKSYTYAELKEILSSGRVVIKHEGNKRIMQSFDFSDDNMEGECYLAAYTMLSNTNTNPRQMKYQWWGSIEEPESSLTFRSVAAEPLVLTSSSATSSYNANQPVNGQAIRDYTPWYITSEQDAAGRGNVIKVETINERVNNINALRYVWQFYYRTESLPNNGTKTFPLTNILSDHSVNYFLEATGVTSEGVLIGNGRTDGTERVVVQSFDKENKTVTVRTYGDFSAQTALLKVQFVGTKNS